MTPLDATAPLHRLSGSSSAPRCTSAPTAASDAAAASERARPRTWCPASINSRTMAEPIKPVAPVTKTFIANSSMKRRFSSCCYTMHAPVRPAMKPAHIPTTSVLCTNTHRDNVLSGNIVFDTAQVYTERDTRTRRVFIIGVRLLRSRDERRTKERGRTMLREREDQRLQEL